MATESFDHPFVNTVQRLSILIGAAALVLCVVGAIADPHQFYQSYLLGYIYWIGMSLGCLGLLMLHHLVSGRWGFVIRRLLESGARTLPLMALLFIPILFGMHDLYDWTHPDVVAQDKILQSKTFYLNSSGFVIRAFIYFALWILWSQLLTRWSREQDRTGDAGLKSKMINMSGPGLPMLFLTASFAIFDWVLSLEPHWFSTMYAAIFIVGQALSAMAMCIFWAINISDAEAYEKIHASNYFADLGTLMFAFVVLWAYVSFSQFLITWAGNLSDEVPWYIEREQGGWQVLGIGLMIFHFGLPFFLLLQRAIKRRAPLLLTIALFMLVMRFVDVFWTVVPAFGHANNQLIPFHIHWLDLAIPVCMGGLWLAYFTYNLKGVALVPLHDPRMPEIFAGESH